MNLSIESIGTMRRLVAPGGVSSLSASCVVGDTHWIAVNAYAAEDSRYECTYVALGPSEAHAIVEEQGLNPTLFVGPDGAPWALLGNPYGDQKRDLVRPIGGAPRPTFPPFVTGDVFCVGDALVLVSTNPFDPKAPDRVMRYDLRTDKRKIAKLPLPKGGRYTQDGADIHALYHGATHRLLSPAGEVLKERTIDAPRMTVAAIDLHFDVPSTAIAYDQNTLFWLDIAPDGSVAKTPLREGAFYSIWPIERAAGGAFVVRYTIEGGNGWVVVSDRRVVRAVHSTRTGWVDDAGAPVVELPDAAWVLAGARAIGDELSILAYVKGERAGIVWSTRVPIG